MSADEQFNPFEAPLSQEDPTQVLPEEPLNPWISIWTKPRATIQQIVDRDPTHLVLVLAMISGIGQTLDRAAMRSLGDQVELPAIFVISVLCGPIFGLFQLYVGSVLLSWTGRWIGGKADSLNIRAAIAWAQIPGICAMLLLAPQLALVGDELFKSEMPSLRNPAVGGTFMVLGVLELILGIWQLVVFLKCLGQVQGFSAWKALGNVMLPGLIIILPFAVIAIVLFTGMR